MIGNKELLARQFFKKCWHQDVVPLGISCLLLFLNWLVGVNYASIISMLFSTLCLCTVLLMIELDKRYIIDIYLDKDDLPEKYVTLCGRFKLFFCYAALSFYYLGWVLQ